MGRIVFGKVLGHYRFFAQRRAIANSSRTILSCVSAERSPSRPLPFHPGGILLKCAATGASKEFRNAAMPESSIEIEAAVFRRLLKHLDEHKEVQNIDLMNLAGFCRNCLSKWYRAEAEERGIDLDLEAARELVYGMPYGDWKARYQREASAEQLKQFQQQQ